MEHWGTFVHLARAFDSLHDAEVDDHPGHQQTQSEVRLDAVWMVNPFAQAQNLFPKT